MLQTWFLSHTPRARILCDAAMLHRVSDVWCCALAKGMTSRPRPIQIPQADGAAPDCGMLLLQAEQNGKRLAASWLGGEDGRLARGQGSETGETTGGTARCEPLPVLVISGASNPQRYGPVHACLRVVAAKSEAVCARKMPSPTFVSFGSDVLAGEA